MVFADWLAIERDDTSLSVWAMGPEGVLNEAVADIGPRDRSGPGSLEAAILALAGPWLAPDRVTEAVICGAARAEGGPVSAEYRPVPCAPLGAEAAICVPTGDPRLSLRLLPGLSQARPPAILNRAATPLAGLLAAEPDFDGVACLPGPRCHWVHVSAGEAVSFVSFLTGTLLELIAGQSVLSQSLAPDGLDEAAFIDAVGAALSRPERLVSGLLPLHAEANLAGLDPVLARSRLSGLLIGAELAAARPYWLGREVVVIGAPERAAQYAAALTGQGVAVRVQDGREATLAGLVAAHAAIA